MLLPILIIWFKKKTKEKKKKLYRWLAGRRRNIDEKEYHLITVGLINIYIYIYYII
jgi:hypothetical protein